MIDDLRRGGAQAVLLALLRLHDVERVEMHVASLGHPHEATLASAVRESCASLAVMDRGRIWDLRGLLALLDVIGRRQIDVVHTHLAIADVVGGLAARLAGRPVVATLHAVAPDRLTHPLPRRVLANWATKRLATELVAVSEAVRASHVAALGLDPGRFRVLRNVPVAPLLLPDGFDPARKRAELQLGAGPVIGMMARFSAPKDQESLVRAMPSVLAREPDVTLLLAGDGPRRPELIRLARRLAVTDSVRFLGHRLDVPELLCVLDVACSLTHEAEGMSISVLDAMSLGLPVVATRVDSLAEVIQDGRNGILVPPRQPEPVAQALLRLLDDPEERRRLGQRARQTIEARLDPQRWILELQETYEQVGHRARRRSAGAPQRDTR